MSSNLPRLVAELERIEFNSDKDIDRYTRLIKAIGTELYLRAGLDAEVLQATLGRYKGRWYLFGVDVKVRAKLVAAHLKISAEAAKAYAVGAIRMHAAFRRHFVEPEQEAKRKARHAKGKGNFRIGED